MSLTWSAEKCSPSVPSTETEGAWRDLLILGSMALGMDEITTRNIKEWMWRLAFLKQTGVDLSINEGQQIPREAVARWIGLTTNAGSVTRATWVARRVKGMKFNADWEVHNQREAVAV